MRSVRNALLVAACVGLVEPAAAQISANVQFCVEVANTISLLPPAGPVAVIHDGTSGNQLLANALWPCLANDVDGSTVTFSTLTPFVHQTVPTEMRDVQLALDIDSADSGANWGVSTLTDQTDIGAAIPDTTATVQAESTGAGGATFSLDVIFITDDVSTLIQGTYCTTVVGTITPN